MPDHHATLHFHSGECVCFEACCTTEGGECICPECPVSRLVGVAGTDWSCQHGDPRPAPGDTPGGGGPAIPAGASHRPGAHDTGTETVAVPAVGDFLVLNGKLITVSVQYLSDREALVTRGQPRVTPWTESDVP